MLKIRIIPTILRKSAVVVKGKNFSKSRVIGPLLPILRVYQSRDVDELIIIDVSNKIETNSKTRFDWLKDVTSFTTMPLSVGGGIENIDQATRIIELGSDKVIINTALRNNPSLINEIASKHGSQSIIASIDSIKIQDNFFAFDSWQNKSTNIPILDLIKSAQDQGAGEIMLTSHNTEGTRKGFDKNLLDFIGNEVDLPLIIHGGASKKNDFLEIINDSKLKNISLEGLAAGYCFHFTSLTPSEVSEYLSSANIPVRTIT